MSFGTGYHESTRLAARLCERFLLPGSSVLDVGTGTGILGIAAARLGARRVVAVDTDEWAYRNARENVTRNNVDAEVTVIQGGPDMGGAGPYDMILANIQRSVIRDILPLLSTRLSQDGLIVVAGLLEAEEEAMMHTFRTSGLMVVARLAENEWLSFALRRGGTA
jgi:ribosomal protein L11 methyltransferase